MVEQTKFTPQEVQHEGLTHSPLLSIYETSKILSRLSQNKKNQDKKHQDEIVEESKHHIFRHGGELKLITCALSDPDDLTKMVIEETRFNGFKYINEKWNLSFGVEEEVFFPVDMIKTTQQFHNFKSVGCPEP